MGIKLGKILLQSQFAGGKHKGLVAVISGTEIAGLEIFSHGQLGNFFAIAENTELGFAHKHFFAAGKAGLPAFAGNAVIVKNLFFGKLMRSGKFSWLHNFAVVK